MNRTPGRYIVFAPAPSGGASPTFGSVEPGFDTPVSFTRNGAPTGRNDDTGRPTYTPVNGPQHVPAAVGLIRSDRHELGGAQGAETETQQVGAHVPLATDAVQGDTCVVESGPWAGTYNVAFVRPLAIHLRLMLEEVVTQ